MRWLPEVSAQRGFGYRKQRKGTSSILLGDLEKAAIDCLYMPRYCPVSTVAEALSGGFDTALFERYATMMRSEGVVRRAGYLLEALGENTSLERTTGTTYKMNPSLGKKGKYEKRWMLYVNEVVPCHGSTGDHGREGQGDHDTEQGAGCV